MVFFSGVINFDKCPMDNRIPAFLISSGGIAILFGIFLVLYMVLDDSSTTAKISIWLGVMCFLFHFGIQIWGSYVVFPHWSNWDEYKTLWNNQIYGCNKVTYLFSFSMLIIYWIIGPCTFWCAKAAG